MVLERAGPAIDVDEDPSTPLGVRQPLQAHGGRLEVGDVAEVRCEAELPSSSLQAW